MDCIICVDSHCLIATWIPTCQTELRRISFIALCYVDRDAKIAALVQNSADTEKLLADTRLEKFAYLKELHNANERCAHLEAKYELASA